jgi:hypothetical protein
VTRYSELIKDVILKEVESSSERLDEYDENSQPKVVETDKSLF